MTTTPLSSDNFNQINIRCRYLFSDRISLAYYVVRAARGRPMYSLGVSILIAQTSQQAVKPQNGVVIIISFILLVSSIEPFSRSQPRRVSKLLLLIRDVTWRDTTLATL